MTRLSGNDRLPDAMRGAVVALGNFDGFHAGHQAVVGHAVARARAAGVPAIVATFDPHPICFFKPDTPPFCLTSLDQREALFTAAGADAMLVFAFDATLAKLNARAFIEERLAGLVGASAVVTGQDFTFGKGREGNVEVLANIGSDYGIATQAVAPVALEGQTVSSSRIRAALQAGDCKTATRLLTRPFALQGVVQHGDKLGRTLNFPTANLALGPYLRPRYGIYAVHGHLADGRCLKGAANLGIRPSFDPPKELLETYFLDFSGDLYGQLITIELIHFLRPEMKFDRLDLLVAQMECDVLQARRILG